MEFSTKIASCSFFSLWLFPTMKFQYSYCIIAVPNLYLNSFFLPLAEKTMECRLEIHRIFSFLLFKSMIGVILRPSSHNWNKTSLRLVVSIAVDLVLHLHVYQRHIKNTVLLNHKVQDVMGIQLERKMRRRLWNALSALLGAYTGFQRSWETIKELKANHRILF